MHPTSRIRQPLLTPAAVVIQRRFHFWARGLGGNFIEPGIYLLTALPVGLDLGAVVASGAGYVICRGGRTIGRDHV